MLFLAVVMDFDFVLLISSIAEINHYFYYKGIVLEKTNRTVSSQVRDRSFRGGTEEKRVG
jgi:hypothetical protein